MILMFKNLFEYKNFSTVTGLNKPLMCEYILGFFESNEKNVIVVAESLYEANQLYKAMNGICERTFFFPMDEFVSLASVSESPDLKVLRIDTLNKVEDKKSIIITNLTGFLKKIDKNIEKLIVNYNTVRQDIINFLEKNSYIKTNLVTTTGEYAIRNFIIDIFPINYNNPIRIEFFGDEIESIRFFDENTQISNKKCNDVLLYSFNDNSSKESINIYSKLNNPMVFFYDFKKIEKSYNSFNNSSDFLSIKNDRNLLVEFDDNKIKDKIYLNSLDDTPIKEILIKYISHNIINFNNNFEKLKQYIDDNIAEKIIIFMIKNPLLKSLIIQKFGNYLSFGTFEKGKVNFFERDIVSGFIFKDYIIISDYDIEKINKNIKFVNHYNIGRKIKGFEDLKSGDYVVHISHGIGQYKGLVTLENNGIKKDYLLINYEGNDKIYVPAQKIETIYKYSSSEVTNPKLNSLNSLSWEKTKNKVRNKIKDISSELIKLYAERELVKGEKYIDFPEEEIFANDFEYEETEDQEKCIKEILSDLCKSKPMDRLLCGDVGFGKTEVAMRAMFKTVINNRQVAYLCPTTILSKQQYENCLKRFRHFPVNIVLLNRFTSMKEFERIKEGLNKGNIDIVVGTHKLLNKEISFKRLGLLVIDEEQRFGVTQKEKIKNLKKNVNVLTLSATPIPRTMKLAMGGLKDLSILDTPPINRYPVQTYVIEENEYLLKEAIYKELSRNGQVYILNNNIESLPNIYDKIKLLVPEARVCIAHGKMDKDSLNNVISEFVDGIYDVLLCTTIIETGIDIPNVNTIIIKDADKFGLSQLYQIRGRVGRSDKIAYAYLLYSKDKMLNDIAIKRLKTIKEFTELGSGYKIAMRDLSIRGAGELLGSSQSGFISSIGIDLYMDMINEEISKMQGKEKIEVSNTDKSLLNISTTIPVEYVDDESLRIEIHKIINSIISKETFENAKNELEDRFGKLNKDIINYMYEEWFQREADYLKIENIRYIYNNVEIELPDTLSNNIDGEKLFFQMYNINPKFQIKYVNKRIKISLNIFNRNTDYVKDLLDLLLTVKNCIKEP